MNSILARLSGLTARQLETLGAVTFAYAALLLTEGVGLMLGQRWAEYLTVVATALLIPLELYELTATATKAAVLAVNVAIVWYLLVRLRRRPRESRR